MNETNEVVETQDESNVVDISKLPKFEQKRLKAQKKRAEELKKLNVSDDEIEAILAREEYASLPIDQKLVRLEKMVSSLTRTLATEMANLFHNDTVITDTLDINMSAVSEIFEILGVSKEKQKEVITKVQEDKTPKEEQKG